MDNEEIGLLWWRQEGYGGDRKLIEEIRSVWWR